MKIVGHHSPEVSKSVFSLVLCAMLFALCAAAGAQQSAKIPRIGRLAATSVATNPLRDQAFRQGLGDLGYIEGKNILVEWRFADGDPHRLAALAAELVRLDVQIIVSGGSTATRAAKNATATIPIIMTQDNDPIGDGFVATLARPGGNITGLATLRSELSGKRLELLTEIVPKLSRVAVLGSSTNPGNGESLKEIEAAAAASGVRIQYLDVLAHKDIETAFVNAGNQRAEAVLILASPVINSRRKQVVELAVKRRLPAIYDRRDFGEAGGLMTYGVNVVDLDRRVATFVDKILKGAKPADLPVEQPKKFEFIINLKAAKQIGLTIPPNVLARADKVIR
jgi:putative ABC transport system substrate-binding protein